jgi:hypothetical protein
MSAPRRIGAANLLFGVVALAIVAGCEAIVGSAVPSFMCSDSDPSSCPVGKVCATATGQCVAVASSCVVAGCADGLVCNQGTLQCEKPGSDAGSADGTVPGKEGGADASGKDSGPGTDSGPQKPYPIGIACTLPADCASGLCADSSILGADYFSKVGTVCTLPCCTSEECGAGLVCVGPGTGGHYCVPAASLGRTLGAKAAGATCGNGNECRAGACVGGVCADSCCADATCGAAKCKPVDVEGKGHKTYACSTSGGPGTDQTCTPSPYDSCASGVCLAITMSTGVCTPPCCGKSTIGGTGNNVCTFQALSNGDSFNYSDQATIGTGTAGTACSLDTKCLSGFCDKADGASMGICADVCCTDNDCTRPYFCRPKTGMSHQLRCTM